MHWKDVPVPERMLKLKRDKRGYPCPVILLEDHSGKVHFAINDEHTRQRLIEERRCAICGDVMGDVMWMPGGPLSALHPHGWYFDTPLHHGCMTYAMQVCPYLGMPSFTKHMNPAKTIERVDKGDDTMVYYDPTMIGEKPPFFVVVQTSAIVCQESREMPGCVGHVRPANWTGDPEVWKDGVKLDEDDAKLLLAMIIDSIEQSLEK